jgi:hypothetical protein
MEKIFVLSKKFGKIDSKKKKERTEKRFGMYLPIGLTPRENLNNEVYCL